jgi:hypothetical protein
LLAARLLHVAEWSGGAVGRSSWCVGGKETLPLPPDALPPKVPLSEPPPHEYAWSACVGARRQPKYRSSKKS